MCGFPRTTYSLPEVGLAVRIKLSPILDDRDGVACFVIVFVL